jgi:hypothetical protein
VQAKKGAAGYPAAPFCLEPTERDLPDALGEKALRKPHRLNIRRPEIMFAGRPVALIALENRQKVHESPSSLKCMLENNLTG